SRHVAHDSDTLVRGDAGPGSDKPEHRADFIPRLDTPYVTHPLGRSASGTPRIARARWMSAKATFNIADGSSGRKCRSLVAARQNGVRQRHLVRSRVSPAARRAACDETTTTRIPWAPRRPIPDFHRSSNRPCPRTVLRRGHRQRSPEGIKSGHLPKGV